MIELLIVPSTITVSQTNNCQNQNSDLRALLLKSAYLEKHVAIDPPNPI